MVFMANVEVFTLWSPRTSAPPRPMEMIVIDSSNLNWEKNYLKHIKWENHPEKSMICWNLILKTLIFHTSGSSSQKWEMGELLEKRETSESKQHGAKDREPRREREKWLLGKIENSFLSLSWRRSCTLPSASEYPALACDVGEAEGLTPCKELCKCTHSLERNVNSQGTMLLKVVTSDYKTLLCDKNPGVSFWFNIVIKVGSLKKKKCWKSTLKWWFFHYSHELRHIYI